MKNKLICLAGIGVTLASFLVDELRGKNERAEMKQELKEEILAELTAESKEES